MKASRLLLLAGLFIASPSLADERDACASASERAQSSRLAGKLVEAQRAFMQCARPTCPPIVKRDCNQWLEEVERALATVVIHADDGRGNDLVAVRFFVDSALVAEKLDGKGIPVDPGPHKLRFETDGAAPVTQDVVIHEAEKSRVVQVHFVPAPAPTPLAESPPPAPSTPAPSMQGAPWILAGAGALGIGTFSVLALTQQSNYDRCTTHKCPSDETDRLKAEYVIAWGSLVVGVAAGALATWLFVKQANQPTVATSANAGARRSTTARAE
jgi:hypothetical protein